MYFEREREREREREFAQEMLQITQKSFFFFNFFGGSRGIYNEKMIV